MNFEAAVATFMKYINKSFGSILNTKYNNFKHPYVWTFPWLTHCATLVQQILTCKDMIGKVISLKQSKHGTLWYVTYWSHLCLLQNSIAPIDMANNIYFKHRYKLTKLRSKAHKPSEHWAGISSNICNIFNSLGRKDWIIHP